jgi:hypothetical protein
VTLFDRWYSTHIAPTLPTDAPPQVLRAAKEAMAACWNQALRTVSQTKFTRREFPTPCQLPGEIREQIGELEARVTP